MKLCCVRLCVCIVCVVLFIVVWVFFLLLFLLLFVCLFVYSPFLLLCNCMLPRWSLQGGSCSQGAQGGEFQSVGVRKVLRAPNVPIL